ncbi:MAG: hypothetical protein IPP90_10505 [Gemmatimonadaceae bacterium]|nr:hypothetical protein [Gemmatimonadaceae bacterium]
MTISATIAVGAVASILFIWIGYPLAIGLVSLVVRRPLQPDYVRSRHRRVSLVIATRDTQSAIAARVANALDTEHPAELLEVIVAVDSGAPLQGSPAFDNRDARVRVVAGDEPEGKAGALKCGSPGGKPAMY